MPKPPLMPAESFLEADIIATMQAGLKTWRPDLRYPESYSDMQALVRALLTMYEVKRRPLPVPLASPCPDCDGTGFLRSRDEGFLHMTTCGRCADGKVYHAVT
jgi:hypothetical protein